jgi:ribosome-binding protein aMBF1 (putative translation factor)
MARRSRRAEDILDRMIGGDEDLRREVAERSVHSRVASMIHEARTEAGLTQRELAELVGTRQSAIARLEDAEYGGHSLSMLVRVAAALSKRIEIRFVAGDDDARRSA